MDAGKKGSGKKTFICQVKKIWGKKDKGASCSRGGGGGSSKSLPPRFRINNDDFNQFDDTSFERPCAIDVASGNVVDHESLDRCFDTYFEDVEEEEDVEEQELEDTPTPTSPATKLS